MNDTPDITATGSSDKRSVRPGAHPTVPRGKLWIFFFLFLTVGIGMYAGTMYRIQNYGYVGINDDRLAHPEDAAPAATTPQN